MHGQLTGIGKTRLALRVAGALQPVFPVGVRLFELADITDPTLVVREVAAAFGISEPPTRSIAHELGDGKLLLVLENREHLLNGWAELAAQLLTACRDVHIIATRRQSLGSMSERAIASTASADELIRRMRFLNLRDRRIESDSPLQQRLQQPGCISVPIGALRSTLHLRYENGVHVSARRCSVLDIIPSSADHLHPALT